MNECTVEDRVELINFMGEEYLFYKSFKCDVALLRGTIADENGNVTFENESFITEAQSIATATKNSGGIVIVQVEYLAKKGTLKPKDVRIPEYSSTMSFRPPLRTLAGRQRAFIMSPPSRAR
jgi:propionate CoA-transferase